MVKISGLAAFAASYPLARQFLMESGSTTPPVFDSLSQIFHFPESARVIGTEYLLKNPGERNIEILTRKISDVGTQHGTLGDIRLPRVEATSIRRKIHDDFEQGRMTQIGGWYLAETEARTCALLSLCIPVTG